MSSSVMSLVSKQSHSIGGPSAMEVSNSWQSKNKSKNKHVQYVA